MFAGGVQLDMRVFLWSVVVVAPLGGCFFDKAGVEPLDARPPEHTASLEAARGDVSRPILKMKVVSDTTFVWGGQASPNRRFDLRDGFAAGFPVGTP